MMRKMRQVSWVAVSSVCKPRSMKGLHDRTPGRGRANAGREPPRGLGRYRTGSACGGGYGMSAAGLTRRGAVMAAALVLGGCLVEIRHVDDPAAAFGEARSEASHLQGRPGPAHRVNVLVFDESDRKLVRVS